MDDRDALSRILEALGDAGIGPIDVERRELLGAFIREVTLWSGRIHLVGKRNISRTITHLVVDSWSLYRWARDGGLLAGADASRPAGELRQRRAAASEQQFDAPAAGTGSAGIRAADVGSGAGFPGIVWKIAEPELDITLFERREKPLRFLEHAISILGLGGIRTEGGDAGLSRETAPYDVVLSKAAGRLPAIAPVAADLLADGGIYLTTKGGGWEREAALIGTAPLRLIRSAPLPAGRGAMLAFRRESSGRNG